MLTDHEIAQLLNRHSLQGGNNDSPWWLTFARDIERAASARPATRAAFPRAWLVEDHSKNAARTYIALLDEDDAEQLAPDGVPPIPLYERSSPLPQDKILDMAEGCTLEFHDLLAFARAVELAHGIGA
jgi:hypothetical protein